MCKNSSYYNRVEMPNGGNCEQKFMDWILDILSVSQSAFLMTVVWSQIANLFIRKTQIATIFSWERLTKNKAMYWALLSEIAIICIVVYVPGLNHALLLTNVPPIYASTGLWIIPFIILWDEIRKWLCRRDPEGWFAKYSII
jgi:magnesium-transporting ATPase (P-type)